MRIGFTPRGQKNIAAPDAGIGLECDKMSREATAFHFRHSLGAVLQAVGPLAGKSFTEIDMLERIDRLEKAFAKHLGPDHTPTLPADIEEEVVSSN